MGRGRVFPLRTQAVGTGTAAADVTVPAGQRWLVKSASIHYVADNSGGDRLLRLEAVIGGTAQAGVESQTAIVADDDTLILFGPGLADSTAQKPVTDGTTTVPLSEFVANAGEIIRGRAASGGIAADVLTLNVSAEVTLV